MRLSVHGHVGPPFGFRFPWGTGPSIHFRSYPAGGEGLLFCLLSAVTLFSSRLPGEDILKRPGNPSLLQPLSRTVTVRCLKRAFAPAGRESGAAPELPIFAVTRDHFSFTFWTQGHGGFWPTGGGRPLDVCSFCDFGLAVEMARRCHLLWGRFLRPGLRQHPWHDVRSQPGTFG